MKNKVMKKRYRNILKRESQETVNQRLESLEQNNKSSLNACLAPSWYWNVSCSLCSIFNNPIQRQSLSISWPASYSLPHYHVLFSLNYYYQKLSSLFCFLSFLFVCLFLFLKIVLQSSGINLHPTTGYTFLWICILSNTCYDQLLKIQPIKWV